MKRIYSGMLAIWIAVQPGFAQSGLEPIPVPEVAQPAETPALPAAEPAAKKPAPAQTKKPAEEESGADRLELGALPKMPVSLEFYQEDIRNVIDALSRISGINMIPSDDVAGQVTFRIEKEPFDQAFNQLMRIMGLVPQRIGDKTLRILTPATIQKEAAMAVTISERFTLRYAKAQDIKPIIDAQRGSEGRKGTTEIYEPTNTLIITDTPEGMEKVRELVNRLDVPPEQVLIEAKIVEFSGDLTQSLGVEWTYAQNLTDVADPNKAAWIGATGIPGQSQNIAGVSVLPIVEPRGPLDVSRTIGGTGVSLPVGNPFGAFTIGYFRPGRLLLTARLSALASEGKAKTLSSPRITTVNNEEAKILIGQRVPFLQTTVTPTGSTQSTQFIDVGIKLTVKPTINADGRVRLKVKPEVSTARPDPSGAGPLVNTREAETTVLVQSGETIVIGGLLTDDETESFAKVPLLADIPVLGEFFKRREKTKRRTELVVFLTPTVLATQ